ncbi:MAG: ABC transporter permease [Cytophagales bacterium]|nr:ABC transporter permease [Cytophagales bacterium]
MEGLRKVQASHPNNPLFLTLVLTERALYDGLRNPIAYGVRWATYSAFGLMLGIIFFNVGTAPPDMGGRVNVIFYTVSFMVFMSVASLSATHETRTLFIKERRNGAYGVLPFVLSQTAVQVPFLLIAALLHGAIAWNMMNFGPFHLLSLIMALTLFVAEGVMQLVAYVIPNPVAALASMCSLNGFFMAVMGLLRPRSTLPVYVRWAHYAAP